MKYLLVSFISVFITLVVLNYLKTKKDKTGTAGVKTQKENFSAIVKLPEFKVLTKTKEFQNLVLNPVVLKSGKDYLLDWLTEKYGI